MKEFNNANLKALRVDIDKALSEVNKKHNIALTIGNIRFSADSFRTTMNAVIVNASDAKAGLKPKELAAKAALEMYGDTYGFKPEQYGKTFTIPGDRGVYKFLGLKPSAPKNKVLFSKVGGGNFHCSLLYAKQFKFEK